MLRSLGGRAAQLTTTTTRKAIRSHLHLRALSTLPSNEHIYIFPHPAQPTTHLLTFLPTTPPNPSLAIGTTTANPPTPSS
ncbi:uncharacterized protein AB675_10110, partial [Cyphellophora attinorum]